MKVSEIMSREPVVVAPGTSLSETAQLMRDLDVGMLPVCDGDRLQGMITDRDIAIRGVAEDLDPTSSTAEDVMTKNVLFCFEDDSVDEAAHKMEANQVRRLVILTREKRLIGVLSLGDLATRTEEKETVAEAVKAISEPTFH